MIIKYLLIYSNIIHCHCCFCIFRIHRSPKCPSHCKIQDQEEILIEIFGIRIGNFISMILLYVTVFFLSDETFFDPLLLKHSYIIDEHPLRKRSTRIRRTWPVAAYSHIKNKKLVSIKRIICHSGIGTCNCII